MPPRRRELLGFCAVLAGLVTLFFQDSLRPNRVLSSADVLFVQATFSTPGEKAPHEPANRLLMDPVLQFQPWLAFNRAEIRAGRVPLWNPYAGCGSPHVANAQSAVFDPFNLLIVLGPWPHALAWTAAARLWFAGLGAFLLARSWNFGVWGRWFSGLTFPFSGFLVVWLLYPVTPAAIWLPWLLLAGDHAIRKPSMRAASLLALCVGGVLVAGHIQTSAHVLLATGLLGLWRLFQTEASLRSALTAWGVGIALGIGIAAVQIAPLADYLTKSPVWSERHREHPAWWRMTPPRLLETACTALPYLYGSQREGHPNLAKGLHLNNLNESAGGFAGLATLVWLTPLAAIRATRRSESGFLLALLVIGAMGAFRLPPVDNLLRALPVVGVMDNRRLTLWVAFALTFLGGLGLDLAARGEFLSRRWLWGWLATGSALLVAAAAVPLAEPMLRERAERHYRAAPERFNATEVSRRVEQQIGTTFRFTPRYLAISAIAFFAMAATAEAARRRVLVLRATAGLLLFGTLADLFAFGSGLNPAIDATLQTFEPPTIARLREGLAGGRAIGVGGELPPNVLMRFGLADARNYDSVELARSLDWFEPLYEPTDEARSSRRTVTWETVALALPRLREASVRAVVGATPPPEPSIFSHVDREGGVWIAWIDAPDPIAFEGSGHATVRSDSAPGSLRIDVDAQAPGRLVVREIWDPGWSARVDGNPIAVETHKNTFISLSIKPNSHLVELSYRPSSFQFGLAASAFSLAAAFLGLTGGSGSRIDGMAGRGLGRNRARWLGSS